VPAPGQKIPPLALQKKKISAIVSRIPDAVPKPVFRILICKFSGLLDPDPLVRGTDPDLDPSIIKQKQEEKPSFLLFCDFFMTFFIFE
jgi:hypothetical protein